MIDPGQTEFKNGANILKNSGVILHSTETVYGLAAIWNDWTAIQKLAGIKERALDQPFSVMVTGIDAITEIIGWSSPQLLWLLERVFPGPITLLIKRQKKLPLLYWNQFDEIGFRIPDHDISKYLMEYCNSPLITTSANLSGEKAPANFPEIAPRIIDKVDFILDSGPCPLKEASTIVRINMENISYSIVRYGAFKERELKRIFNLINS